MQQLSIFSNINDSEWSRMVNCFRPIVQSFEAGEYIMTFSEKLDRVGIMLSGSLELQIIAKLNQVFNRFYIQIKT